MASLDPNLRSYAPWDPNLANDDLASLIFLNRRLNDLGIGSISIGAVVSYAMECYEKGLITHTKLLQESR